MGGCRPVFRAQRLSDYANPDGGARQAIALPQLYIRRSLRIFPLYYALLIFLFAWTLLAHHVFSHEVFSWGDPLWTWLYLGNIQMAVIGTFPPLFSLLPLWSLHVEEQFYILFPFLVRNVSRQALTASLIGSLAFAPVLRAVLYWRDPSNRLLEYMLLTCRLEGLALGAVIAINIQALAHISRRALGAAALGGVAMTFALLATAGHGHWDDPFTRVIGYSLPPIAFACVVLWILLFRGGWQTRWLNSAPAQFIGKRSYGIYLLQYPVSMVLQKILHSRALWGSDLWRFTLIAVTTSTVATFSWRFLERPILSFKDRLAPQDSPLEQARKLSVAQ